MLAGTTTADEKEAIESAVNKYFDMIFSVGDEDVCAQAWAVMDDIYVRRSENCAIT